MSDPFLMNGSGGALDNLGVIAAEDTWELDTVEQCFTYSPAHPLQIPIIDRQWRNQPHGKWHLTIRYEGVHDIGQAESRVEYEGDSGSAEAPIETHPLLNKIRSEGYPYQEHDGRIVWDPYVFLQSLGKEVPNPMFGVDAYHISQPTWTQHRLYAALPEDVYRGLNCIFLKPPGPVPISHPIPEMSDKPYDWLLERVVPRHRGNIWQVSRTWAMSGPGGWNRLLYGTPIDFWESE